MSIIDVSVSELDGSHSDIVGKIQSEEIDGAIVRNAISMGEIKNLLAFFEKKREDFPARTGTRVYNNANLGEEEIEAYLKKASLQRHHFSQNLECDLEAKTEHLLNLLTEKSVSVPYINGNKCNPFTVRRMDKNNQIVAHVENEILSPMSQGYYHLNKVARLKNLLSFFYLLRKPEEGGELILYDLEWNNTPQGLLSNKRHRLFSDMRDAIIEGNYERRYDINLEEGDLIIFAGGRIWHKVDTVLGDESRYTIGGFIAPSKTEDNVLHYWS